MPVVSTGTITIADVNDGLLAYLTNEAVLLSADSNGTVSSFTDANSTFKIFEGGIDKSSSWTFYISATGGNISYRDSDDGSDRTGTGAVNGLLTGTVGFVKIVGLAQDQSYLDITAIRSGYTDITKRLNVAKVKTGVKGDNGTNGQSYRIAYSVTTSSTAPGAVTSGTGDVPPTSPGTWSFTATSNLTPGQYMYQVDGIYNPVTGNITWGNPYLSNLKVGSLSAIAVDTGNLTVGTTGSIKNVGGSYGGDGFFLGYDSTAYKFSVGSGSDKLTFDGTNLSIPATKVTGLLTASQINSNGLTIKDNSGNVILGVGTNLDYTRINASTGWVNDNVRSGGINLVGNSGFLKHDGILPTNWSSYNNAGISVTRSVQSGGLFGQNYFRIVANADTTSTLGIHVNGNSVDSVKSWEPGQFYVISYWARGQNGAVGKYMNGYDSNMGFNTTTVLENPALTGTWQRYVFRGIPNSNAQTPVGELYLSWSISGTLPSGSVIDITCPKVELGTQPSAWTPSPQDTLNQNITLTGSNGVIAINNAGGGSVTGIIMPGNQITQSNIDTYLANNAVVTSKLLVTGKGKALNDDPTFQDPSAWSKDPGGYPDYGGTGNISFVTDSSSPSGTTILRVTNAARFRTIKPFPVTPFTRYKVSVWARRTSGSGTMYIRLYCYNHTGGLVNYEVYDINTALAFEGISVTSGWTKYTGYIDAGAGTAYGWLITHANWDTTGITDLADLRVEEYIGSDLIVDGAITANKISAGAVQADKISTGAVTADKVAANSIKAHNIVIAPKSLNPDPLFFSGSAWWNNWVRTLPATNNAVPSGCPHTHATEFNSRDNWNGFYLDVQQGEVYKISIWVNRHNTSYPAGWVISSWSATGTNLDIYPTASTTNTGWQKVQAEYVVPSTVKRILLGPWINGPSGSTGSAWFTGFEVERKASADLIVDGAITANKINVTDLSSITANVGTLTAGLIRNSADSFRVDVTNGRTITTTGSYMKVTGAPFGSSNQFIEWYGAYQSNLSNCTEANATYYLKTNGAAYFGGSLSAGTLTNKGATSDLGSTAEIVVGPFGTNGSNKTVTLSYVFNGWWQQLQGSSTGSSSGSISATVKLYRKIGNNSEAEVATLNVTGTWSYETDSEVQPGVQYIRTWYQDMSGSITYTDSVSGTDNRTYRAQITARSLGFATTNGTNSQRVEIVSIE